VDAHIDPEIRAIAFGIGALLVQDEHREFSTSSRSAFQHIESLAAQSDQAAPLETGYTGLPVSPHSNASRSDMNVSVFGRVGFKHIETWVRGGPSPSQLGCLLPTAGGASRYERTASP